MLENIDRVEWGKLTHAYGEASDVPDLIRNLAGIDSTLPLEVVWTHLYSNIWHQGTIYEATAYAIPFLIELLQNDISAEKGEILTFLYNLATGNDYLDVYEGWYTYQETIDMRAQAVELQTVLSEHLYWEYAAAEAVRAGAPVYGELLQTGSSSIRVAAAYLLSRFASDNEKISLVLVQRLETESDPFVRAAIFLSLGQSGPENPSALSRCLTAMTDEDDILCRVMAAMAVARMARDTGPAEVGRVLLLGLIDTEELEKRYPRPPWSDAGFAADISRCLVLIGPSDAQIDAMIDAFSHAVWLSAASQMPNAILRTLFRDSEITGTPEFSTLSVLQQKALRAIAQNKRAWVFGPSGQLRRHGLPTTWETLREYVGLPVTKHPSLKEALADEPKE